MDHPGEHRLIRVKTRHFLRHHVRQRGHMHTSFPQPIGQIAARTVSLSLPQLIHHQHHRQRFDRIHSNAQYGLAHVPHNRTTGIQRHRVGQPDNLGRQQGLGNQNLGERSQSDIGILDRPQHALTGIQTGRKTELTTNHRPYRTAKRIDCVKDSLIQSTPLFVPET